MSYGVGPRLCVAMAVASGYSSDFTPSLGNSICHRCSPRKTKDKKKKKKKERKKRKEKKKCFHTRLLVYYERIQLRKSQMEETLRAR